MSMDNEQEVLELEGKFKTAAELGLSEAQRCGLVKTLAFMEAGKLMHVNRSHRDVASISPLMPFNMTMWRRSYKCGTVCCIGGTAEFLGRVSYGQNLIPYQLRMLFGLVDHAFESMNDVTERQAGVALRHYLETGITDWDTARKSPR